MAKKKTTMAKDARENMQIKEEEKLTTRTKTILDKEHAITEQQKIKETRWVPMWNCISQMFKKLQ